MMVQEGVSKGSSDLDHSKDRSKFSCLCDSIGVDQPEWSQFVKMEDAIAFARKVYCSILTQLSRSSANPPYQ
eukprot:384868-Amphidinium_carterae.1